MGGRPEPFADLQEAEDAIWQMLARATRDRRSAWHTPVLATVGTDGAPQARVLVLRAVDRRARLLRLHTDVRTAKVDEIRKEPRASLLLYDPGARLQLRASGIARIEHVSQAADTAWSATRLLGRRCYTAPDAPGSTAPGPVSGLPPELESREPTPEESEAGRPNFAVLLVELLRLEFLQLAFAGHRRGAFAHDAGTGAWAGRWLVP
ncbi:MAG: pyridoxamine 5'-phosphate oxidase family protein [Thermaurantiacus sp.]